jgi:hypothetical protein
MTAKNNPWAITMIFKIQNTNPHYAPMDTIKVTDYSYPQVEDALDKMKEYRDAAQVIAHISRKS